jgi:hypothetical protein
MSTRPAIGPLGTFRPGPRFAAGGAEDQHGGLGECPAGAVHRHARHERRLADDGHRRRLGGLKQRAVGQPAERPGVGQRRDLGEHHEPQQLHRGPVRQRGRDPVRRPVRGRGPRRRQARAEHQDHTAGRRLRTAQPAGLEYRSGLGEPDGHRHPRGGDHHHAGGRCRDPDLRGLRHQQPEPRSATPPPLPACPSPGSRGSGTTFRRTPRCRCPGSARCGCTASCRPRRASG